MEGILFQTPMSNRMVHDAGHKLMCQCVLSAHVHNIYTCVNMCAIICSIDWSYLCVDVQAVLEVESGGTYKLYVQIKLVMCLHAPSRTGRLASFN